MVREETEEMNRLHYYDKDYDFQLKRFLGPFACKMRPIALVYPSVSVYQGYCLGTDFCEILFGFFTNFFFDTFRFWLNSDKNKGHFTRLTTCCTCTVLSLRLRHKHKNCVTLMDIKQLPREKENVVIACKFIARIQRKHHPRNKQGKTCKCC